MSRRKMAPAGGVKRAEDMMCVCMFFCVCVRVWVGVCLAGWVGGWKGM